MSENLQNSQNSTGGGNTEGGSTDRYIRVRTDYYKIVEKPMTDGSIAQLLIKWKYGTIKADHGREFAEETPCYDDFIIFPDNVNRQSPAGGGRQILEPLSSGAVQAGAGRVSKHRQAHGAHLRGTEGVGLRLPAAALPPATAETAHHRTRLAGAKHGQVHLHALPSSVVR